MNPEDLPLLRRLATITNAAGQMYVKSGAVALNLLNSAQWNATTHTTELNPASLLRLAAELDPIEAALTGLPAALRARAAELGLTEAELTIEADSETITDPAAPPRTTPELPDGGCP